MLDNHLEILNGCFCLLGGYVLEIKGVSKCYSNGKKQALKEVTFHIKAQEFVALLGQNGAGKTTLINILGGNVKKDGGSVKIAGLDLDSQELLTKRKIGIVPQEISIDFNFTVLEILKFQSGYFGKRFDKKYAEYLLEKLSLSDKIHVRGRFLSGGMKRRLLIAKALIHDPEIIILDEPTAGVDIELRHSLYLFLQELKAQGKTIILTTHYLEEAEKLCDRIIMIKDGEVIADESKQTLLNKYATGQMIKIECEKGFDPKSSILNGYDLKIVERELSIQFHKSELSSVLEKLTKLPVILETLSISQSNLEDVFLHLTRKGRELNDTFL